MNTLCNTNPTNSKPTTSKPGSETAPSLFHPPPASYPPSIKYILQLSHLRFTWRCLQSWFNWLRQFRVYRNSASAHKNPTAGTWTSFDIDSYFCCGAAVKDDRHIGSFLSFLRFFFVFVFIPISFLSSCHHPVLPYSLFPLSAYFFRTLSPQFSLRPFFATNLQ